MSQFEQDIRESILKLEDLGILDKDIVLFGAGNNSRKLYEEIKYRNHKILAVIDNNRRMTDKYFDKYLIQYAPDFIRKKHINTIYLILSIYYSEIKKQLEEIGLIENLDFYQVLDINTEKLLQDNNIFNENIDQLIRGKNVYEILIDRYGENTDFLLNPANSIGDIYLMSFYVDEYIKESKNVIFVFGSEKLEKLANSLEIRPCIHITQKDMEDLIKFAQVFQFEKNNLKLLHTGFIHFRIWSRMLTYLGITWMEHYKELFELPKEVCPDYKDLYGNESEVEKIFLMYNLKKGRTILLSPYANTIQQISLRCWDELAEKLIKKGFCVCTNVGGKNEVPIKNTVPLCVDIYNFSLFVEKAGCFIGMRNGLCDLLLKCKAKIIILYSNEIFDLINVYDFYSLEKMGKNDPKLEEIIYEEGALRYIEI